MFKRSRPDADGEHPGRWVVVGLGNPGDDYAQTRHNAGVMTLEVLVERLGARLKRHKSNCLVGEVRFAGAAVVLARPLAYMNDSGRPVRELVRWYKAPLDHLVVVHDEIDIAFGEIRVKSGGGTAGHNGLSSVAAHLGSKEFVRVRVGVSRPRGRREAADHVLARFTGAERKELPELLERAADAVERVVEVGVERAMNEFNTRTRR